MKMPNECDFVRHVRHYTVLGLRFQGDAKSNACDSVVDNLPRSDIVLFRLETSAVVNHPRSAP